jgi:2-keto-4-pentenoate hydratase
MTGDRKKDLLSAANLLLDARRTGVKLEDLPEQLRPVDVAEIYAVQDAIALAFGEIGGWKIGAPTPEATPLFAPMPLNWIAADGATLTGERFNYLGLEA